MMPSTDPRNRTDALLLVAFCGFLFFYGLGAFGLLGADEPRYAQIAREMLNRGDWVTPTLFGKPWLEKPVLYYWQAMLAFRVAGVSDQTARLPGAADAALLIAAIYFFLRRFRRGSELEGALITASCAGVIGFAHAAATDMPLAATFSIAMLAWYAWYEGGGRIYLASFYVFLALGTLAKGPVAPGLAALVIFLFVAIRRKWIDIRHTLWIPGIVLYLAVALPWYVAVQLRNPEFFHFFILEHNLARFSQNIYRHHQPIWFYLPVFLLAMMPWPAVLVVAVAERIRLIRIVGREVFSGSENSWTLFLLVWMFVPILFFSASQSKLPGYILPAVPAGALLVAQYLADRGKEEEEKRFPIRFAGVQGILCGLLIFGALSAASIAVNHRLIWTRGTYVAAVVAAAFATGMIVALRSRAGLRLIRPATMMVVVLSVGAVVRLAGPAIDATQSARPVAESIQAFSHEAVPIALYHVNRAQQYGLEFYLNRQTQNYEGGTIPSAAHVVVAAHGTQSQVAQAVAGRRVSYLTTIPEQKLDLYWVGK
jgi:4-amino-4-deoxy-L-arabinose transferase-like glycosyltransferase